MDAEVFLSDSPGTRKPPKDLRGKYNRWEILEYSHCVPIKTGGWTYFWKVRCQCGTENVRQVKHIVVGRSTSCGCKHSENLSARNQTHGLSKKPEYQIWKAIWQRCTNKNHIQYVDYGARNISVASRWRGKYGFENFLKDMGPRPAKNYSIERINNNQDYGPNNCRWATSKEQHRNKRNNLNITFEGRTQCLADWADELKMNKGTLYHRVVTLCWPTELAFNQPLRYRK